MTVRTFADIPGDVRRRVDAGERVLLILLDAFGLEFLQRHGDHPLVARLQVSELRSQFPSTTTAHVTTTHFGVPVEEHGLYEWNVLEPSLGEIICPLRFDLAGAESDGALADRMEPSALAPGPTFYETLGIRSAVAQPWAIAGSVFTGIATRGARVVAFKGLSAGVRAVVAAVSGAGSDCSYALLYWDAIDRAGHEHGPSSPQFAAACRAALDALWETLRDLWGVTVLITADHGQIDVHPDRVDYLDDLWPELPALIEYGRPAGSSRDVFLHVGEDHIATVIEELSARLGDRATVRPAADLFDHMGPRLRQRLGDVVVLPSPGREVWLRRAAANERWFLGQHGGLEDVETATYLAVLS